MAVNICETAPAFLTILEAFVMPPNHLVRECATSKVERDAMLDDVSRVLGVIPLDWHVNLHV